MNKIQIYNNGEAYWVVLNNENDEKIVICKDYYASIADHAVAIADILIEAGQTVEFLWEAYNEGE